MMKLPSNKIKIIVLDVGKTIFDKEKQSEVDRNLINVLKELQTSGVKVGVCTMRTINSCKTLIPLKMDFYISLNGALVLCDEKIIKGKRIKNIFCDKASLMYGTKDMFYSSEEAKVEANNNGFLVNKKGILKRPYVITLFNVKKDDIDYLKIRYSVSYWDSTKTITLQAKNCNKVNAIMAVLKYYGYNETELLFFGDGPNDLEVFKTFSHTIMVKNGHPCLKEYAFSECLSCLNNGVYQYLINYQKKQLNY